MAEIVKTKKHSTQISTLSEFLSASVSDLVFPGNNNVLDVIEFYWVGK